MKNRKGLWLFTVFGLLVLAGCLLKSKPPVELFRILLYDETKNETIKLWKDENENLYVFLPGYAKLEDAYIALNTGTDIVLNGVSLYDGMSCSAFECDVSYDVDYKVFGFKQKSQLTFVQSTGVATMFLDTESGNMENIHAKQENEETGLIMLYTADGKLDFTGKIESISGRGNYTWANSEKKPYSITLEKEANLLGLGQTQKWVLLANAADPSHIRNKIVYDFADAVGLKYSPDSQWVNLYLNGEYVGLYLLSERLDVHVDSVNINQNTGFLVSVERAERIEPPYIKTDKGQALRIRYPVEVSNEYFMQISKKWQTLENVVIAENGIDAETGKNLTELIDLDSWAKKYLIEEIFANADAGYTSHYYYSESVEESALVFAGPVWDYDLSMGNKVSWQLQEPKSFFANRQSPEVGVETPWLSSLYKNDVFYSRFLELYKTRYLEKLEDLLDNEVLEYTNEISSSAALDQIRWNMEGTDVYSEAKFICDYLEERIEFLNSVWIDKKGYSVVTAVQQWGGYYAYFVVLEGERLTYLPEFEETETNSFVGWYYSDTNEPFDINKPITEDIEIYAKWVDKPSKKVEQIVKLAPLGVIGIMGLGLLTADIRRNRKSR